MTTKLQRFFDYLKETGETLNGTNTALLFWIKQYDLLEAGVRDGRLHDASLVAYSRLEAEINS